MTAFYTQPCTLFQPDTEGAWTGISMETYHLLPGESNSSLALLDRSPLRYRLTMDGLISRPPSTHDQEMGILIHAATNEGEEPPYYLRPETYGPDAKKWNGNASACREWVAAHQDKPILDAAEVLTLNSIVATFKANARAQKLLRRAQTEVTACARNPGLDHPYMLRCRFDVLGCDDAGWYFCDTKSCRNAATDAFSREIVKRAYHAQMALYRRVLAKLTGEAVRCFLIIIEKDFAVPRINVRQLSAAAMDAGDRIIDARLALLKRCKLSNTWPAFVDEEDGEHIPFIELPEWAQTGVDGLTGLTETEEEAP